jgi:hypothetical protein
MIAPKQFAFGTLPKEASRRPPPGLIEALSPVRTALKAPDMQAIPGVVVTPASPGPRRLDVGSSYIGDRQ